MKKYTKITTTYKQDKKNTLLFLYIKIQKTLDLSKKIYIARSYISSHYTITNLWGIRIYVLQEYLSYKGEKYGNCRTKI